MPQVRWVRSTMFAILLVCADLPQPTEVRLSARRAWQIKLDNGAVLELGRADTQARLARFVKAQSRTPALQVAGLHADLRYGSGLALRNSSESAAAGFEKATRK